MSTDLAALDAPIRSLFERIAESTAAETPNLGAVGDALVALATDREYVDRWVERLGSGAGSLAIHAPVRGARLSIVHRPEGQLGAVHDHGTWVVISPISGIETHRRYRARPENPAAPLHLVESVALEPRDVVTMLPPEDIHDHGHVAGTGASAYVLILTGDDQTRYTRHEWDPATGRRRVLPPGDPGRWLANEPWPDR